MCSDRHIHRLVLNARKAPPKYSIALCCFSVLFHLQFQLNFNIPHFPLNIYLIPRHDKNHDPKEPSGTHEKLVYTDGIIIRILLCV